MNTKIKRLENGIFVMVDDTHLSRWVERDGRLDHDHRYLERFRNLVPEGGTVIDCGTSIGDHTVTYASWVGPSGCVIGFEANPDVYECCALNLGVYPWARVFNVGLSNEAGVSGIKVEPNVGASFLIPGGREIMLAPLDDYTKDLKRCDFIKIDVEGFEVRLLLGAKETISRFHPPILMEVNEDALRKQGVSSDLLYECLLSYGYKWRAADGVLSGPQYDILAEFKKK